MSLKAARGDRGKADKLFSKLIRSRGKCAACPQTDYRALQCAHIISRRYSSTRTDTANAICLCWTCHRRFTDHPDEWMAWIIGHIGFGEYDRLKKKALAGEKVDWAAECVRLKGLLEEAA